MMGPEFITVSAGGGLWTAYERFTVTASFHDAARSFELEVAAESGPYATFAQFRAGAAVDISSNGSLLLRGYVDRYQPSISEHDTAIITVSGRSRSQDFIDSSAKHDTNQFKDKTPAEIGQALDLFGVGIATDEQLDKVPVYRITPGETAFRCVEKLCREQGVFVVGQADGSIKLTKGGKQSHSGLIREGYNMIAGEADHNWSGRHSEIIVRGQRPIGHGDEALQIEQIAKDGAVGRYRPIIIIHDGDTDRKRAKKRAKTRRDREAGNSLKARVTVQGFRDDGGQVWEPGNLVFLQSPFLAIAQMMAIDTVTFTQDRKNGSRSVLALVDPKALGGDASKGGSLGDAWNSDAGGDD
jgi:prophage tail gpP-like protein